MAFNQNDDDTPQRFALGLVFALVALVVVALVGTMVYRTLAGARAVGGAAVAVPAMPAGAAAGLAADAGLARIVAADGLVRFYFATGSADLPTGAQAALRDVAAGVKAGGRAVVSGFHDATGDAAANEALARQRALAVRDALLEQGADPAAIDLDKPMLTTGSGSDAEARRVEVVLKK